MIQRRNLLTGLATTFALAACGRGVSARGDVLRVGSQRGGTKSLMLASGALDGAGFKVDWSEFPAAQNLLEALGIGAVDVGLVGDAPFLFAYQAGGPIKAVTAQKPHSALSTAIVVPRGSPIQGAGGLKGKRIATGRGSIGHYLLLRAMNAAGLATDDVTTVFLSPSDARAALQAGSVDGWSTWMPYVAAALAEGARVLLTGEGLLQGYGFDAAPETTIRDKRALLSDFAKREARALQWAIDHVEDYAKVLAQETGLPLAIARETGQKNARVAVPIDGPLIASEQVVLDTFGKFGAIHVTRPLKDAFELGI